MDPAIRIAELEQQNKELLRLLTRLHHDAFAHQMTPHTSSVLDDATYMRLMGTMSETRTLIRKLGGETT